MQGVATGSTICAVARECREPRSFALLARENATHPQVSGAGDQGSVGRWGGERLHDGTDRELFQPRELLVGALDQVVEHRGVEP